MENATLGQNCDLTLVDHSCGGEHGGTIDQEEATMLAGLGRPLILLGEAHGVIDRLTNYSGEVGQITATGIIQKAHDEINHTIYSSPYSIAEAGFGPIGSIGIFSHTVSLESYPDNTIGSFNALAVFEGAAKPVIGALYSPVGTSGRIFWWAFSDPTSLNTNGLHLFVNTLEWMGGLTDLGLLLNLLKSTESRDPSKSTFWTGGYADYFEPEIRATYYAYASLRHVGRITAIDTSALSDWLATCCYIPLQGYFHSPTRYSSPIYWSGTVETGMALVMLSELGELGRVNSSKASEYVEQCQLAGFVRYSGDATESLTNTYWALLGLNATGQLAKINRISCIDFILSCQNLNQLDTANYGGFADYPGTISSATSTFMALSSLKLLAAVGSVDLDIVEQWLMNGYDGQRGIFYEDHLICQRYTVNYGTGYSVACLAIMGKLQNIDQSRVAEYLSSAQFSDGGWSGANSTDESIDEIVDCYPVILGLQQMNRVPAIRDLDGFIAYVIRCLCPAPSYGFANLPRTFTNLMHTSDGISILSDLGAVDSLMAIRLNDSIISSYHSSPSWFESSRCLFPTSSDGYWKCSVEQPYEFTQLQRDKRGVAIDDLAISSLLKLGCENWVKNHARELWNEIVSCEITAGSSSGCYKRLSSDLVSNLTSGLRYTYHALSCLWELATFLGYRADFPTHLINATMTIKKLTSLYEQSSGSFSEDGYVIGPYSVAETSYMALASLSLLGGLSNIDRIKAAGFLESHLYSNLVDTYYSFKGLQVLNKLSIINVTRLIEFIRSCQKPSGAFQSSDNMLYRLETTRMATEILSYYNKTWLAARPIVLMTMNLEVPEVMHEGSTYLLNVTVVDNHFMLNVGDAEVSFRLGTYEVTSMEAPDRVGDYTAHITVPVDRRLLGEQSLVIRCSKEKYQTSLAQVSVDIQRGDGISNITMTQIAFTLPLDGDHLTTSNTSIAVKICAINASHTPVVGAQLRLYFGNSLAENSTSDQDGSVNFKWTPKSSGTYDLRVLFQGSSTLDASEVERTIIVSTTPTQLLVYSDHGGPVTVEAGASVQLATLLSQAPVGKPVAGATITFVVLTPSGFLVGLPAMTGEDGVANMLFTANENGSYSIYSRFTATDYYSGCNSNTITLVVGKDMQSDDGDGHTGENGDNVLLLALNTPFGLGLILSSCCLLTASFFMKARGKVRGDSSSRL
jgi:prenyltransferase beta subunit